MRNAKIAAVILAAGKGERFGGVYKQFTKLGGKHVLNYSIDAFLACRFVGKIIVVLPKNKIKFAGRIIGKKMNTGRISLIEGGETRPLSSYNALKYLGINYKPDYVIFHDAARPLVTREMIKKVTEQGIKFKAASAAVAAIDTVAEGNGSFFRKIPDKDKVYYVYLPQCYEFKLIKKAYARAAKKHSRLLESADNSTIVLNSGKKIKIVDDCYPNFKLTYKSDMSILKSLLKP